MPKPIKYLLLLLQLSATFMIAALHFTYTADVVAGSTNYFIAIAIVPLVSGISIGYFWNAINPLLSSELRIQKYRLVSAHAFACLLPTALYLLVMSLPIPH